MLFQPRERILSHSYVLCKIERVANYYKNCCSCLSTSTSGLRIISCWCIDIYGYIVSVAGYLNDRVCRMAKPSCVLACVVVFLSVTLLAVAATGLGLFLGKYKGKTNVEIDFVSSLALDGYFMPLLGVPVSIRYIYCLLSPLMCYSHRTPSEGCSPTSGLWLISFLS